ncbi:BglG family transcription antiterminator [Halobacillus shinanisalinarum]|uniref:BglG family transcription antiterminator n=1 Tax=Halobacillus shinanisalinarum TaxID=2932258 RepID=A0ABY4H7T1_9BACI|nr:BglG family transcription antiterminator [Halobacillus shinanisalinarum]UOQ95627.1 BglG family transcription antiterminator [Halobacillus shinanisalinarum]
MNDRQKELVRTLILNSNEFSHVQDLSVSLACSEKTVRNDLKVVEEFLKGYPTATLVRKPGVGVHLSIEVEEKSRLFDRLSQSKTKSQEDRLIEITYQLLVNDRPVTLNDLAKQYYTNKPAIKSDLGQIARWLKRFELELISKQRLGHIVKGRELQKRNALARLPDIVSSTFTKSTEMLNLFPASEVNVVRKLLGDMQHHFSIISTEGDFESLLIHVLVMLKRTKQRSPIMLEDSMGSSVSETEEYGMATWFLNRLERMLRVSFPEDERRYFTRHLLSSRGSHYSSKRNSNILAANVVDQLISQLENVTVLDFSDDQTLNDGLHTHLESTINRLQYGFTIHNPMLEEIKKMYPYMFSMVVLSLEKVGRAHNLIIPEDEAAYLVLHFQASIERLQKQRDKLKKVLIVCDLGVGMSHLLQAKLEQTYKGFDIIGCIGEWEIDEVLTQSSVDLIISTKALQNIEAPIIVVSPLLEAEDKKRLDQFLKTMERGNREDKGVGAIGHFLNEEFIYLDVRLEHRFEVVEMLANGLVEKGRVTKAFPHSALVRERSSATSIGGAIAIPHAHPEEVQRSTVATAILHEPLEWGSERVSIVFLLAMTREDKMMTKPLIQAISTISRRPELIQKLIEAQGAGSIRRLLNQ